MNDRGNRAILIAVIPPFIAAVAMFLLAALAAVAIPDYNGWEAWRIGLLASVIAFGGTFLVSTIVALAWYFDF